MWYLAILHQDRPWRWGVSFPDFPGCVTGGESLEEAKKMARDALHGHLAAMRAAGLPIPDPSPLAAVTPHYRDRLALLAIEAPPEPR
jgi:predicted RNase H-like HicB family nuclease